MGQTRPPRSPRSNASSFFRRSLRRSSSLHGVRRRRHPAVPQRLPEQLLLRTEQAVRVHDDGAAGIAADYPGLRPLVEGEGVGLCVDPASRGTIAAAVNRLAADPQARARMRANGLRLSTDRYNWAVEFTPLLQLYRALAAPTAPYETRWGFERHPFPPSAQPGAPDARPPCISPDTAAQHGPERAVPALGQAATTGARDPADRGAGPLARRGRLRTLLRALTMSTSVVPAARLRPVPVGRTRDRPGARTGGRTLAPLWPFDWRSRPSPRSGRARHAGARIRRRGRRGSFCFSLRIFRCSCRRVTELRSVRLNGWGVTRPSRWRTRCSCWASRFRRSPPGAGFHGVILAQASPVSWRSSSRAGSILVSMNDQPLRMSRQTAPRCFLGASGALDVAGRGRGPYLEAVILSKLAPVAAVGYYGAARNILGTLVAPAVILGTASYPRISRAAHHSHRACSLDEVQAALRPLLWLGALGALGTFLFADTAVRLIYGRRLRACRDNPPGLRRGALSALHRYPAREHPIRGRGRGELCDRLIIKVLVSAGLSFLLVPVLQARTGNGGIGLVLSFRLSELIVLSGRSMLLPRGTLTGAAAVDAARALDAGGSTALLFRRSPRSIPGWHPALHRDFFRSVLAGRADAPAGLERCSRTSFAGRGAVPVYPFDPPADVPLPPHSLIFAPRARRSTAGFLVDAEQVIRAQPFIGRCPRDVEIPDLAHRLREARHRLAARLTRSAAVVMPRGLSMG